MPLTVFTSPRFADHLTPPGHPERIERFEVMQAVVAEFAARGARVERPRAASDDELLRVHDEEYLALLRNTSGRATALDADTFTSPETFEIARLAAGAAIGAVEHVLGGGRGARACAVVRPPGHHAERNRALGFCLLNNIAVAAAHARARGADRVAVVDFDVHHGNGTQWTFYDDPAVLFISSHQYPYYPGTGAAHETGSGKGAGYTVNLPLAAGATDADSDVVYTQVAMPVLRAFRPDLILISAGFDAYMDDPLAGMRVTAPYFGELTRAIAAVADECCDGRVAAITEGGYDLKGLADSLRASMHALEGTPPRDRFERDAAAPRGRAAVEAVLPHLAAKWRL